MQPRNTALATLVLLAVASCASPPPPIDLAPHGFVEGAVESPEPQLRLAAVGATGTLTLVDLLDGSTAVIGDLHDAASVSTDGRYVFAASADAVTIADTGVWTIDHEDHFHYYRAAPRIVGTVEGAAAGTAGTAEPTVSGGALATSVFFAGSGETVLLDSAALGEGTITELARIPGEPHDGLALVLGETLLVTTADAVVAHDLAGTPAASESCAEPAGGAITRVGAVVGCADGALLFTSDGGFERIPYPDAATPADRALEFRQRVGRPTLAAVAADSGYWLLDTRAREWTRVASPALLQVAAVDDAEGHVVALAADGRVLVFDAAGAQLAATGPLLPLTLGTAALTGVEVTVDAGRAYLNAPLEGTVFEIDYADGARIAREFGVDAAFLMETGR